MAKITLTALSGLVGNYSNEYKCTQIKDSTNLKIEFADIRTSAVESEGASRDEVKFVKLISLARHIRAQGFPATLQAAWDTKKTDDQGNKIYVPWPAIYVNNEARTNAERTKVVTDTTDRMDRLEGMFAAFLKTQGVATEAPVEEEAPAPEPTPNEAGF